MPQQLLTTKNIKFEEYSVLASICRESLYEFVKEFWDVVVAEEPVWNWHIKYICRELQKVAEFVFNNKPKRHDLIINISPGSTKSTLASIMFPAWTWTRMPSARTIGGSYAKDLSMDLSRKGRDVVKSEKYRNAFPEIELRSDQDVKSYFANTKGGARLAVGTGGAVTGFHAHFIIVDDPLDPNRAVSEVELKNANIWMAETLAQRKVSKAVTPTILIMQRLHQNDPTADMINRAKSAQKEAIIKAGGSKQPLRLKHIRLPAEVTDGIKPVRLRRKYVDGLMDSVRLPQTVLTEAMANGSYMYSSQFLQDPVPLGGGMFKTDRIVIDTPPGNKWLMIVRFWDKAATADDGAYTVGVKMGQYRDKRFWVLNVVRGRWSSDVREKIIKQTAEIDGKGVEIGLEQEPGSGGKESTESTVKNLAGFRVRVDKPTGDKVLRADPFSVQVNNGNVSMVKAEWNFDYLEEHRFFPYSTFKDQVDGSSGAFNELTKPRKRRGSLFPKRR